ncbi:MAG: ribonuclease 3 [Phycisphaeraceae bacterium]|nr:MAG: ribonuclease 3 [Phycisphaeraceae bacterium]
MDSEHAALLERAQGLIGYRFADPSLLTLALTHSSLSESRLHSNERLEFLGDAVLGMLVCARVFESYPDLLEGEMTKIKSTAVSRRTCAEIARKLEFDTLIRVGKGMQSDADLPASLSAAVLESIIGAVYEDGGIDPVAAFLVPLIDPIIDEAARCGHQRNFKSVLQQHAQQELGAIPLYRILDEKGPDHAKAFKIVVEIAGKRYEPSWGQSKKQSEQQAALNALRELGVIETDEKGRLRVTDIEGVA